MVMLGERQAKSSGRTVKFQRKGRFQTSDSLNCDARLLPFSVETTGGMARGAIELLEQVSLACRDTLTVWPHWQIEVEMKKAVAVAVQKGNAMIMLAGYNAAVMPTRSTKVVNRMEDDGQ